jgi:hypothetical protein
MLRKIITAAALASLTAGAVAALAPSAHAADFNAYKFCGMASNHMGANAGTHTSCAFAKATIKAYAKSGYAKTFRAYSPVTHRSYTMTARWVEDSMDSGFMQITGGNGASVRMTS